MHRLDARAAALAMAAFLALPAHAQTAPAAGTDLFVVRSTTKAPDAVVDAIKAYVDEHKWVFIGTGKVKPAQGEVTFVKVCVPEVGRMLWPLGLKLSAMLPCGNIGIYQNQGRTEVSMLHPRYMPLLYPAPEVEKAADIATPLMLGFLDAVTQ